MAIEDLIIDRIEEAAARLDKAAGAAESSMMNEIESIIRSLEYAEDGTLKPSLANSKKTSELYNRLRRIFTRGEYAQAVAAYVGELGDIAELWDKYFTELIGKGFNPDRKLFERIWSETVEATTNSLTGVGVQDVVGSEAQKILRANINGRASAKETEQALRAFIKGSPDKAGRLKSYVKQVSRDGASQFSRNYTQAISETLGIEWFFYSGGTVRESREFCIRRQGGYYHKSEIEGWATLQWQGKIPETNATTIFSYLGGYNCMHILRPVATKSVPKDALNRIPA